MSATLTMHPEIRVTRGPSHHIQVGEEHLMTVRVGWSGTWPYEQEEIALHCLPTTLPLFVNRPCPQANNPDNLIVLRSNGQNSPACFVVTAHQPGKGVVRATLINQYGAPMDEVYSLEMNVLPFVRYEEE